jgi:WD40 repeat protein
VKAIAADRRGRYVATAADGGPVKVWDMYGQSFQTTEQIKDKKVVQGVNTVGQWAFHTSVSGSGRADAIGFTPDGKRLITGWSAGSLRGCDVETKNEFNAKDNKLGPIKRLVVSPNGERVAAIDVGGSAKVWEPGLQRVDLEVPGRMNAVAVVKSDDRFQGSDITAVGGDDGVVQVWEMFFKNVRAKLLGHQAPIVGLAFSPDGKRLASADASGTVIIWVMHEVKPNLGDPVEIR